MFTVRKFRNSIHISTRTNRINLLNIHKLRKQFILALQTSCDSITLNLEFITFIDSSSFEVIDEMIRVAKQHQIDFSFVNLNTDIKEIFQLMPNAQHYTIKEDTMVQTRLEKVFSS